MQNTVGGRIVADAGPQRVDLPHGKDHHVAGMYVCICRQYFQHVKMLEYTMYICTNSCTNTLKVSKQIYVRCMYKCMYVCVPLSVVRV